MDYHDQHLSPVMAIQQVKQAGYKEHLYPQQNCFVGSKSKKRFSPEQLKITAFIRTKDADHKENNFQVYGVVAPDGSKGVITNSKSASSYRIISRMIKAMKLDPKAIF